MVLTLMPPRTRTHTSHVHTRTQAHTGQEHKRRNTYTQAQVESTWLSSQKYEVDMVGATDF